MVKLCTTEMYVNWNIFLENRRLSGARGSFKCIHIVKISFYTYLPMKMEQTECSETSAYKIQTPGNYPEQNIQQNITTLLHLYGVYAPSVVERASLKTTHIHMRFGEFGGGGGSLQRL